MMSEKQWVPKEHEQIEVRIRGAARTIRRVDMFFIVVVLLTGMLAWFFLFLLLDHWCFPGGLPPLFRVLLLLFGLAGSLWYVIVRLLPLFRYGISPVYAAHVLEKQRAGMKNTLINWTLIRRELALGDAPPTNSLQQRMMEGITVSAARDLNAVPFDLNVNHVPLLRWIIILAVLIATLFFYSLFSPKNPWVSLFRLALPFARIDAPGRYRFLDVSPGDVRVFQGENVLISARVEGAGKQPVQLHYWTDDKRIVDQVVPMSVPQGGLKYECVFPPGKVGFEKGVTYQIGVGQDRSRVFRLDVVPPQTLEIHSVVYRFPEYTGREPVTVERVGDIRALEGTQVFLNARSNFEMDRAAFIPDDDERKGKSLLLSEDRQGASTSFEMAGHPQNPARAEYQSYVLRGYDVDGKANRKPSVYRIELLQDQPPRISWIDPPNESPLRIPFNGFTETRLRAEDADFGIRTVRLHLEVAGKRLVPLILLQAEPQQVAGFQHAVQASALIKPKELGLKVGDVVQYWGEAVDTRLPDGNTAFTEQLTFIVDVPKEGAEKRDADPNRVESPQQKTQEKNPNKEQKAEENSGTEQEQSKSQNGPPDDESSEQEEGQENGRQQEKNGKKEESQSNGSSEKGQQDAGSESNQGQSSGNQQGNRGKQENNKDNKGKCENCGQSGCEGECSQEGTSPGTGSSGGGSNSGSSNQGTSGGADSQETGNSGGSPNNGGSGRSNGSQNQEGPGNSLREKDGLGHLGNETGSSGPENNGNIGNNGQMGNQRNNPNRSTAESEGEKNNSSDRGADQGESFDRASERRQEPDERAQDIGGIREQVDYLNPDSQRRTNQGTPPKQVPGQSSKQGSEDQTQQVYAESEQPGKWDQQPGPADPNKPILENPGAARGTKEMEEESISRGEMDRESPLGAGKELAEPSKQEDRLKNWEQTDLRGTESVDPNLAESIDAELKKRQNEGRDQQDRNTAGDNRQNEGNEQQSQHQQLQGGGTGEQTSRLDDRQEETQRQQTSRFQNQQSSFALKSLEEEAKAESDHKLLDDWSRNKVSTQKERANSGPGDEADWREMLRNMQTVRPQQQTAIKSSRENQDRATVTGTRRFEPPKNLRDRAKAYNEGIGQ